MRREEVRDLLQDVFGKNTPMQDIGGWVSIRCPLSPWTHERGADSSPSAGVSIQDNDTSIFNCFTCKNTGPISSMLRKYAEYSGEDLDDLIDELEDEEYLGPRTMPSWDSLKEGNIKEVLMPINEGIYMDLYDSAAGHPYLLERGIDDATAERLELKFDPSDPADREARILFPVRGYDGLLYGFSGRAIRTPRENEFQLKVRDYEGLAKAELVLGAHLVAQDNPKNVCVVEGLFDYARMNAMGYPGTAVMHSNLTEAQADIFRDMARPAYLFYDNDKAGQDGVEIAANKLRDYIPVMRVRYPRIQIEDRSRQGWHWLKDPGELLPEDVEAMIKDSRIA